MLLDHGIYPLICKPTRKSEHSAMLIGNVFTNNLKNISSGIFITDISHHFLVFMCSRDMNISKTMEKRIVVIRDTNELHLSLFENKLKFVCWDILYSQANVNSAYNMSIEKFTTVFHNCCLLMKVDTKYKFVRPCFTGD